jgi:hypothetical protein
LDFSLHRNRGVLRRKALRKGFSRELIRWNGHVLRMHKDGVT